MCTAGVFTVKSESRRTWVSFSASNSAKLVNERNTIRRMAQRNFPFNWFPLKKKTPKCAGASVDWNTLGGQYHKKKRKKSLETNNSQLQMRSAHSMTVIFWGRQTRSRYRLLATKHKRLDRNGQVSISRWTPLFALFQNWAGSWVAYSYRSANSFR